MIQKFAAKVLSFYEVRNTRVTEYLHPFGETFEEGKYFTFPSLHPDFPFFIHIFIQLEYRFMVEVEV